MKTLFGNKLGGSKSVVTPVRQLLENLSQQTAGRGAIIDASTASAAIALEGFGESSAGSVETALDQLKTLISQSVSSVKGFGQLSVAQEEAAVVAGFGGSTPLNYVRRDIPNEAKLRQAFAGVNGNEVTTVIGGQSSADRIALEAFDERVNRNAMTYSVAYNLQASRQSEFGEAFYPTVVVTPDNVGFTMSVRLLYAYSEVQRATSGALNNFNRQNIIRAIIDHTILTVDQTKLIPVYRKSSPANAATDSDQYFAPGVAPVTLVVDNQPLTTAPLAVGKQFSILGISQTNAMLQAGIEDQTDAVDSSVRLQNIYVQLGSGDSAEVFRFDVSQLPTSDWNAAPQGNTRLLQLNFNSKAILFNSSMTTADGVPSALLAALGTASARLSVQMFGSLVQDLGDTTVNAASPSVAAVNDNQGNALSTASGIGATVAGVFADAQVVGYDLLAFRTNSNRRNRGKLLDIQHVNYLYTVPLLPPITSLRPVGDTEANDGNLLSNLITATRVQTANAAVTALIEAQNYLSQYANSPDVVANQPTVFGVASNLVVPAYADFRIDCATALDSLTSSDRAADLQALLLNKIRDMATRLFVSSGYGPASEAMYEGTPPKPLVIIGTDPTIYRYLTLTGDLRYMGDMFDYKIVPSYDQRMAGRVVFSFGSESSLNSGVPNPLHFGNMGWKPELTLMMPMVRNGANVMELTVQPSYRHVTNLPVMGVLYVDNIQSVIGGKVAIDVMTEAVEGFAPAGAPDGNLIPNDSYVIQTGA